LLSPLYSLDVIDCDYQAYYNGHGNKSHLCLIVA